LLNDTGTRLGGEHPVGFSSDCATGTNILEQDCNKGRDALAHSGSLSKIGSGSNGFDFDKIDSNGFSLPVGASSWSCVIDNQTGFMWEIKSSSSESLYAADDIFTLYNTDGALNGGAAGEIGADNASCFGYVDGSEATYCNTEAFVNRVNAADYCGYSDWRIPTFTELLSIIDHSQYAPAFDATYFPNATNDYYWSASPVVADDLQNWNVRGLNGYISNRDRTAKNAIRLIRTE
jgi:hypothetical protein